MDKMINTQEHKELTVEAVKKLAIEAGLYVENKTWSGSKADQRLKSLLFNFAKGLQMEYGLVEGFDNELA